MSHTKEPWMPGMHKTNIIDPKTGFVIVTTYTGNQNRKADIRRIIECVNWCAGHSTEEMERMVGGVESLRQQLEASQKQVVMLRDALEAQVAHDKLVSYERCPDCDYRRKCSRATGCLDIKDHSPIANKALATTEPK